MRRREKKRFSWIEFAVITVVSCAGFVIARECAALERGYDAIGGECLFLFLPAIYFALKGIMH